MEGPSLVILRDEIQSFTGRKVLFAKGYAPIDHRRLINQTVVDFKTWGKHFLICFKKFTVRINFGLFGSYRINEEKKGKKRRLPLQFSNGVFNCYAASVKMIDEDLDEIYDWSLDMLS